MHRCLDDWRAVRGQHRAHAALRHLQAAIRLLANLPDSDLCRLRHWKPGRTVAVRTIVRPDRPPAKQRYRNGGGVHERPDISFRARHRFALRGADTERTGYRYRRRNRNCVARRTDR